MSCAFLIVPHLKQALTIAVQGFEDVSIFCGSFDVIGTGLTVQVDHFVPSGPVSIIIQLPSLCHEARNGSLGDKSSHTTVKGL